ncbi:MAG: family 20 glycosylhydrolase [Muribaculaceae bacterium]
MKRISNVMIALLLVAVNCGMSVGKASAAENVKPFVVPELAEWTPQSGTTTLSGRIVVKDKRLKVVAQSLAADYEMMFGKALTVVSGKARRGDVVLNRSTNRQLGDEGYSINIGNEVVINAATEKGAYWATRTLLQMSEQSDDYSLPCGSITDAPQYRMRGFMIDCGRKYIPISYLKNLVKVMGYYKMNTLQVHLNDNGFRQFFGNDWSKTQAAFRLESDTYPGLTAKDGHYTKKEFIELQKLAQQYGVEVIPEIDVPAHSLAFTHYRPDLGSKEYGMDHLDLFNPDTYTFLDDLFMEYLGGDNPVFIGPRVHIGTDEYSNAKREVVEKFREFTDHYIRLVESYGKQAVVWGALTHANGDTKVKSDGVLMHCWYNGYANPREMKRQGYQLVSIPDGLVYIVPAAGYYYDYLNCKYLYEKWTPAVIGREVFDENDPSIEGGMFAVWNDHVGNGITVKDIHHRVFPALQTLSAKCWSGKNVSVPYDEFNAKRQVLSEAPGVNELARHGKKGDVVVEMDNLSAGSQLPVEEIGYDYSVSFVIDGVAEQLGAELLRSANAVFYLSDPKNGRLGFEREGYLNTFNYSIEKDKKVTLTIEGNNRGVRLLVDGKVREELAAKPLFVVNEDVRARNMLEGALSHEPVLYDPKTRINYQRTLVFPLRKAGDFKSIITNFKVTVL